MTKENLKAIFTNPYNREDWQKLIHDVFPRVTFFSLPHPIPVLNEEIKEFYHTGNIRLNDGKSLAIFELHVSNKINLKRNRVTLHSIITKYIDQESHHGVLALFDSSSDDYRFTFTAKDSQITESGFETKITDAKRFTYVFGPKETCRTAADRFNKLAEKKDSITIKDVEDAFSVEKLNKEFFNKYKEQYEKFVCRLTGKRFVKKAGKWEEIKEHEPHEYMNSIFQNNDKKARDFIKKSLGRLVFLYFLQKKGWLGCSKDRTDWKNGDLKFMQHYFDNCTDKEHFHSKFLVPLYFECLNKKRDNDVFEPTKSRIPYLNGGLFDEEKLKIKTIDFPTKFWESLFTFFAEYNFTIDENDPFEQEVGIDPEMLGHIFENLLEDNKDKGAFYTPKPIVEYMCKESLIQYLKTHLFPQNSPLSEGWQTKSDGVLNSPLSEGYGFSRRVLTSQSDSETETGIFQNYKQLPFNPQLKERARELRQAGNLAEVLFWKQVRNGNFLSLDFHRQKIIGNYIVDFYCPALQLVVEIDGSSHNDKIEYDKEREDYLKALELNIIHFSDLDVKQNLNSVMERLKEYCEKLVNTQNSPLLEGYGFSRGVLDSPLNDRNENTPPDKSSTPLKEGNLQALENFIRNHDPGDPDDKNNYIRNNAEQIEKLLDDVKICDPAIGSGAFPMGLLQEIFWAKMTLDWTLNPAETKKKIIENSIYGVDIDSGAIDIARLRFWLSLIVDAEVPEPLPNLDYKIMQGNSLLESFEGIKLSKVMSDRLTVETVIDGQQDLLDFANNDPQNQIVFSDDRKKRVQDLKDRYFFESNPESKKKIHREIDEIVLEHIESCLEVHRDNLQLEITNLKKSIGDKVKGKNQETKEHLWNNSKDGKLLIKFQQEFEQVDQKYKKLEELQYSTDRPFFLWHLYFSEVFENTPSSINRSHPSTRGEFCGGFDIVIGNPPYVQLQKDYGYLANLYEDENFETFERTGDIYCLFYEQGYKLLTEHGNLCYITSNKWMRANYGKATRKFLAEKTNPKRIIDFGGYQVFENATVDSNILLFAKEENEHKTLAVSIGKEYKTGMRIADFLTTNYVVLDELNEESWVISNSEELNIKKKIERLGTPLKDWDISIYRGVLTGYNEAFIIDGKKKDELIAADPKNADIIKPILRGRDIKRYQAEFADLWLINSHNGYKRKELDSPLQRGTALAGGCLKSSVRDNVNTPVDKSTTPLQEGNFVQIPPIDINDYPAIKKHLDQYWEQIEKRCDQGDTAYNLRSCAYLEEFEKEKVVYPETTQGNYFFFDKGSYFVEKTAFLLISEFSRYLTAVLSSKLITLLFKRFYSGVELGKSGYQFNKHAIANLPICDNFSIKNDINKIVDQILSDKQSGQDTQKLEDQIDLMVYKLYELTYEEAKIVDPAFSLSKEEYENFKLGEKNGSS